MNALKIKIMIVCNSGPHDGGSNTYEQNVLGIIEKLSGKIDADILTYHKKQNDSQYNLSLIYALLNSNILGIKMLKSLNIKRSRFEKKMIKQGVDLIYFTSPNILSLGLNKIPYINTIWDLGHLEFQEYPEIFFDGNFTHRQFILENSIKKAICNIVESYKTRDKLRDYFGVPVNNICNLGLPLIKIDNNDYYVDHITEDYIIYPAKLWKHKNHLTLIDAFKILTPFKPDLFLVFTGYDENNLNHRQDTLLLPLIFFEFTKTSTKTI
jgi:glycosyltransferase involved in cell wall biosynthesis